MSQPNPYLAPQAALSGGTVPMANVSLPREMLVVAAGFKLILWGLVLTFVGIASYFLMQYLSNRQLQGMRGQEPDIEQVISIALRPLYVMGGILTIAQLISLFGFFKCTQIPGETQAKGAAQLAFVASLIAMVLSFANYYSQYQAVKNLKFEVQSASVLTLVGSILSFVALFAFITFLKKTSIYIGDALSIDRSKDLMKRCIVLFVLVLLGILSSFFLGALKVDFAILGILILSYVAFILVASIWTFIVYVRTLTRMRTVIHAGVV
jgi:hypothetical protein